jgi:hypothetical protein
MRKHFYVATMLVAALLGTTSCKEDKPEALGGNAPVAFTLASVSANGTSISDGKSVDKLVYAVYDQNGAPIQGLQQVVRTDVTFPTTETIDLVKGQTYKIIFWAQDNDCRAYTTDDLRHVGVSYAAATNNDESRDAFYAVKEVTITGSEAISVELTRPFAQINVGVTTSDAATAKAGGIEIAQSSIEIENAANEIDLFTGLVSGSEKVTYSLADIPTEKLMVDEDGDGTRESEYVYMSMSYILVDEATTGAEKTTLDKVAINLVPQQGAPITITEGLTNVPVQRNWRTNILGQMLTSGINFYITIDPAYKGDIIYPEYQNLSNMLAQGGNVTIYKDLIFDNSSPLVIPQGVEVVLNMNGHKLINNVQDKYAIHNEGKLTIKNGIFDNLSPKSSKLDNAVIRNSGELIIEGGVFGSKNTYGRAIDNRAAGKVIINGGTFDVASRPEVALHVIVHRSTETMIINNANIHTQANGIFATQVTSNAPASGELIVNGGSYTLDGADSHYMVYAPVPSTVTLNGGTYTWYKGANPNAAIWNKDDNQVEQGVINISSACKRLGDEPWTTYVPNIQAVETSEPTALADALASASPVITLGADIVGDATAKSNGGKANVGVVLNDKTLDGNGYAIDITTAKANSYDSVILTTGGTIKNATIGGQMRGIYVQQGLTSPLIVDNVILDNVAYPFNLNTTANTQDITFTNSTLNGWTSYSGGSYQVTFTNCKFGKGTGAWAYAYLRPYTTTTLENCDFEAGFIIDVAQLDTNAKTITFKNCTLDGTPITAANVMNLLEVGNTLNSIVVL